VPNKALTRNGFYILSDPKEDDVTAQTLKAKQLKTPPIFVRQANYAYLFKK